MNVRNWPALIVGGLIIVTMAVMAVFPALFTTADPLQTDLAQSLIPPSPEHPFGTDQSGRDVFARVVHGARISLGIAVLAIAAAWLGGLALGTLIALVPKAIGSTLMRGVDLLLAVPEFLLALVIVALFGPGLQNVALAISLAVLPVYIRLAWARARALRFAEHVEAARLVGVARGAIVARHILPSVTGSLSVLAVIGVGSSILSAAGLSFLGLGITEPTPEWGLILSGGRNVLAQAWWIATFPGAAITITVIGTGLLGRALRSDAA